MDYKKKSTLKLTLLGIALPVVFCCSLYSFCKFTFRMPSCISQLLCWSWGGILFNLFISVLFITLTYKLFVSNIKKIVYYSIVFVLAGVIFFLPLRMIFDSVLNNVYLASLWVQFNSISPKAGYQTIHEIQKVGIVQGHGHCDYYVAKLIKVNSLKDLHSIELFYANKQLHCFSPLVTSWEEAIYPPIRVIPCSQMAKEKNYLFKIDHCTDNHLVLLESACIGSERNSDLRCSN